MDVPKSSHVCISIGLNMQDESEVMVTLENGKRGYRWIARYNVDSFGERMALIEARRVAGIVAKVKHVEIKDETA